MYSAENGHLGVVEYLVTHGANVNLKNEYLFAQFLIIFPFIKQQKMVI